MTQLEKDQPSLWLLRGPASDLCRTHDLQRYLSTEERERVHGFGHDERRAQFTVGRAVLRRLLAPKLGIAPEQVELRLEPSGKPRLHDKHQSPLCFSISHTANLLCWAIHPELSVGVDVEAMHHKRNVQSLAQRFFHAAERDYVATAADASEAGRRFIRCWTMKEAWYKAFAGSRSLTLSELCFAFDDARANVTAVTAVPSDRATCLCSIETASEHVIAVAARQGVTAPELSSWELDPETLMPGPLDAQLRHRSWS